MMLPKSVPRVGAEARHRADRATKHSGQRAIRRFGVGGSLVRVGGRPTIDGSGVVYRDHVFPSPSLVRATASGRGASADRAVVLSGRPLPPEPWAWPWFIRGRSHPVAAGLAASGLRGCL